jgi:single-stranded-DNA-specific exonuclease
MELPLVDLDLDVLRELSALEPFGSGNPEPMFYTRGLRLRGEPRIMAKNTLKFWVSDGNRTLPAIGFGMADMYDSLVNSGAFDMLYKLRLDAWNGEENLILEIKDLFVK